MNSIGANILALWIMPHFGTTDKLRGPRAAEFAQLHPSVRRSREFHSGTQFHAHLLIGSLVCDNRSPTDFTASPEARSSLMNVRPYPCSTNSYTRSYRT